MSTDLELSLNLPKLQLPAIKVQGPSAAEDGTTTSSASTVRQSINDNEEECRTPTSDEHKIPTTLTCPPAPKKPKRTSACKRKLSEFEFFEAENRKEVDGFFIMSSRLAAMKRRCAC